MARSKRGRNLKDWRSNRADPGAGKLRIIGGTHRGRLIEYSGDPVTRPMKDNTREALFNLIGGWVAGKAVLDLFAGTGAIGLESLSRGAAQAIFVERHFPTVKLIEQNIASFEGIEPKAHVFASDTFFWVRRFMEREDRPAEPWMVFCCPPYDLFVEQTDAIIEMLAALIEAAPDQSIFVVESDERFDVALLPGLPESQIPESQTPASQIPVSQHGGQPDGELEYVLAQNETDSLWQVRRYAPAQVAVMKFPE